MGLGIGVPFAPLAHWLCPLPQVAIKDKQEGIE